MAGERTRNVESICHAALERDPSARASFLAGACAGDEALRREVESLLAHAGAAEDFLETPGLEVAAQDLVADAAVAVGRQIGTYRVQSLLGVGGMGEVYRAHDTTLGRDVAIKVLPRLFLSDPDRLARFEREARVLASLNHPHIAAIYGVEQADGTRALVLELVEGLTLADRLTGPRRSPDRSAPADGRGVSMPLGEAVDIARQIADALEAAHEKGIVHRDLKPANIKLNPKGVVKARPLDGTDNASYPFWSPDSQSIGFFADGELRRIDLERGSVRVLGPAKSGSNGAWNQQGTILFSDGWGANVLWRVPADGSQPRVRIQNTQQGQQAGALNSPVFLPDGRHFLFHVAAAGIYAGQLEASEPPKRIVDAVAARYASSGHLLFVRQGTLFAQSFDSVGLELTGDPIVLAEQIFIQDLGMAALSASAAGSIVYRTREPSTPMGHFVWHDRSGKVLEAAAGPHIVSFNSSLSPDGRYLAYSQNDRGAPGDIWLLDLKRGVPRRFTNDPVFDMFPVWSPDDLRIAFGSDRVRRFQLYVKPVDATRPEEPLGGTDHVEVPTDWSSDGRFLLYARDETDIWALDLSGDRHAFAVVETMFKEVNGQFSPDRRWIAYQSDESGSVEIYVQPFPGPAPRTRISSEGGFQVRWRADGEELFYIASDSRLMAVPIRIDSQGLEAGAPVPLFATQFGGTRNDNGRVYMVSRDGQRILLATRTDVTLPITVILNWKQ